MMFRKLISKKPFDAGKTSHSIADDNSNCYLTQIEEKDSYDKNTLENDGGNQTEEFEKTDITDQTAVAKSDIEGCLHEAINLFIEKQHNNNEKVIQRDGNIEYLNDWVEHIIIPLLDKALTISSVERQKLIAELVSDQGISTKDLQQIIYLVKLIVKLKQKQLTPSSPTNILQAVIDTKEEEAIKLLEQCSLSDLYDIKLKVDNFHPPNQGSINQEVKVSEFDPVFMQQTGYSQIQDVQRYSNLLQKVWSDKGSATIRL